MRKTLGVIAGAILAACGGASQEPKTPATATASVAMPTSEPVEPDPLADVEVDHGGLIGHEDLRSRACGTGPSKDRMYIRAESTLEEFPEALTNRANQATFGPGSVYVNKSNGAVTTLPPNTAVDLLRRVTDHETHKTCSLGVVRIVDAGGPAPRLDARRNTHPKMQDVTGKLYVVTLDDLTSEQTGPSPAEYLAQKQGAQKQESAQARQDAAAVQVEEIKTGRCEDARAAKMQNTAANLGRFFTDGMSSGSDSFMMIDKKIVVATKSGTPVTVDGKSGGDEHLYAIGFDPVRIELKDSTGYPVRTVSPYATVVQSASGGSVDSRTFHANLGEQLQAKVAGSGCTLVVLVRKL